MAGVVNLGVICIQIIFKDMILFTILQLCINFLLHYTESESVFILCQMLGISVCEGSPKSGEMVHKCKSQYDVTGDRGIQKVISEC